MKHKWKPNCESQQADSNRRRWIARVARGGALVALGGLSAEMLFRDVSPDNVGCPVLVDCRRCGEFPRCVLSPAETTRHLTAKSRSQRKEKAR